LAQQLGDLDRIEGRPLADLVATEPELQGILIAEVLADAADGDRIAAGDIRGHREAVGLEILDQLDAGGSRQQLPLKAMFTASEWALSTGTRTQVAVSRRSGQPMILRVSLTIFSSSSQ